MTLAFSTPLLGPTSEVRPSKVNMISASEEGAGDLLGADPQDPFVSASDAERFAEPFMAVLEVSNLAIKKAGQAHENERGVIDLSGEPLDTNLAVPDANHHNGNTLPQDSVLLPSGKELPPASPTQLSQPLVRSDAKQLQPISELPASQAQLKATPKPAKPQPADAAVPNFDLVSSKQSSPSLPSELPSGPEPGRAQVLAPTAMAIVPSQTKLGKHESTPIDSNDPLRPLAVQPVSHLKGSKSGAELSDGKLGKTTIVPDAAVQRTDIAATGETKPSASALVLTAPTPVTTAPTASAYPAGQANAAPALDQAIEQIAQTRDTARAARPEVLVRHAEFGLVAMRIDAGNGDLRATLSSRDPGFVPAVQAMLAERAAAASAEIVNTGQRGTEQGSGQQHGSPGSSQGNNQSGQGHGGQGQREFAGSSSTAGSDAGSARQESAGADRDTHPQSDSIGHSQPTAELDNNLGLFA